MTGNAFFEADRQALQLVKQQGWRTGLLPRMGGGWVAWDAAGCRLEAATLGELSRAIHSHVCRRRVADA